VFCGVRTERELPRLEWRDIDLDHRQIVCIRPLNAKNRTRRYIPLAPNAVAWLRYYLDTVMQGRQPEPQERVLAILSPEGLRKARRRVWRGIGQQPSRTAGSILRHVFASNHLAFHNDIDRLCSEMEHRSPDTLFRHYANGVTSDAAAEFWRISPQELASHKARAAAFDAVSIDDSAR
jgi:integrase